MCKIKQYITANILRRDLPAGAFYRRAGARQRLRFRVGQRDALLLLAESLLSLSHRVEVKERVSYHE